MRRLLVLIALLLWGTAAAASGFGALARIDTAQSTVEETVGGVELRLALSQPVPWRAYTLDSPRRLVLDFADARVTGELAIAGNRVSASRFGPIAPGWSRAVFDLAAPLAIGAAALSTVSSDGSAMLTVRLDPTTSQDFAARAGAPASARFERRQPMPTPRSPSSDRLRVVLDPGHGGIDPGAERDGLREAELMLTFARELRDVLRRTGRFDVLMTRDADVFVPLEARLTFARAAEADLFLSLHADALPEDSGQASGATLYTLSAEASDLASERLAERHDGADLMAGVDLTGQGDEIALVLMDLARADTAPRSLRLAEHLIRGIGDTAGGLNRKPLRSAAFSVLKSPDIPSVLLEIGFLSSAKDRERIASAEWRLKAAEGIADALLLWAEDDSTRASALRRLP